MEIKSPAYTEHLKTQVAIIPMGSLIELIDEFAINAKFYMSSDIDSDATAKINAAIIDMLKGRFKYLPLYLVAEAYMRGSLGELGGTTRFTVRNIYIWLTAIEEKQQRLFQEEKTKIDAIRRAQEERSFRESQKRSNLFAAAMYWKISHCPMSDAEYDRLTLDKIVEAMQKGYTPKELQPLMIP